MKSIKQRFMEKKKKNNEVVTDEEIDMSAS
jgi:hypothetical protein